MNSWTLLLCAVGVAVFLEGLPYFVSPAAVRRFTAELSKWSDAGMRSVGLAMMTAGLLLAYVSLH